MLTSARSLTWAAANRRQGKTRRAVNGLAREAWRRVSVGSCERLQSTPRLAVNATPVGADARVNIAPILDLPESCGHGTAETLQ